jgi:hypothetical protein
VVDHAQHPLRARSAQCMVEGRRQIQQHERAAEDGSSHELRRVVPPRRDEHEPGQHDEAPEQPHPMGDAVRELFATRLHASYGWFPHRPQVGCRRPSRRQSCT